MEYSTYYKVIIGLFAFSIIFTLFGIKEVKQHSTDVTISIFKDRVSALEIENQQLKSDIDSMKKINNIQAKREIERIDNIVEIYERMGKKNLEYAEYVYQTSKLFEIDALLLTILINSESMFVENVTHKNEYVKGISGIHTKFWDLNISTIQKQIFACGYILRIFIDMSDGDILEALTLYKGKSPLGRRQAMLVYNEWLGIK